MTRKASKHRKDTEPQILRDVVSALCGCYCDDLVVAVADGRIVSVEGGCAAARDALLGHAELDVPASRIDDAPVTVEEGIDEAVKLLRSAKRPMITGLEHATCEAQRACVSIADRIGGLIDAADAGTHAAILAMQQMGQSTCTWGEVMNRADVILFWGARPAQTHAGLLKRILSAPASELLPNGGTGRTYAYVDHVDTSGQKHATLHINISASAHFESLWALRALAKGIDVQPETVESRTGVSLAAWKDLLLLLKGAKYAVIFFGEGLTAGLDAQETCEALFALVRDLNAHIRVCCNALTAGGGNAVGAENVLAWRTGYPMAVDFGRGYPRFGPGENDSKAVLDREETDLAITLTNNSIRIGSFERSSGGSPAQSVHFQTATFGIACEGTIHRGDEVALPLRAILQSKYKSHEQILRSIDHALQQLTLQP